MTAYPTEIRDPHKFKGDRRFLLWHMSKEFRDDENVDRRRFGDECVEFPLSGLGKEQKGEQYRYPGGVYAMIGPDSGRIYYVGRATDLAARLGQHGNCKWGSFGQKFTDYWCDHEEEIGADFPVDCVCIFCDDETMRRKIERGLILRHNPMFNKRTER
jgi:hypothetical protein